MKKVDLFKCPYNAVHLIPKESFLNHLRKCQATNKNQFTICKFDPYHIVRKQALQKHYLQCQSAPPKGQQIQDESFWNDLKAKDEEISINTWGDRIWEKKQEISFSGMFGENAAPSEEEPICQQSKSKFMKGWEQGKEAPDVTQTQSTINSRRGNRTRKEKIEKSKQKVEQKLGESQFKMGDW